MKFRCDVEWGMTATVEVEAADQEEAARKLITGPLPKGEYLSDSFMIVSMEPVDQEELR